MLEDLWQAICAEYPEEAPEPDPLTIEREAHEAFAEERSRLHVGRENEARRLTEYVQGSDRRPALIAGESGCGKSAFLASWSRRYASEHPDDLLLSYFVGASPSSTDHRRLLRTICGELKRELSLEEEIPEEDEKLPATRWRPSCRRPSRKRARVVLVIDALDQLSPLEGAHGLGWLLDYIPEQTRLVVSTLEGDCLDVLRRRGAEEIALPPLSAEEQRQIVETVLGEWRRKLDKPQLTALLDHPGVSSPLYLRVALEELRLFGRFEQLLPQIEDLAADVDGAVRPGAGATRRRPRERARDRGLLAAWLVALRAERSGAPRPVAPRERGAAAARPLGPACPWRQGLPGRARRAGRLLPPSARRGGDDEIPASARKPTRSWRPTSPDSPLERKLDEYPYQLQQGEDWQALSATLSDLDFLEQAWDHERKYEWMGYWRSLEGRFEPGACYQAALDRRIETGGRERARRPLGGGRRPVPSRHGPVPVGPAIHGALARHRRTRPRSRPPRGCDEPQQPRRSLPGPGRLRPRAAALRACARHLGARPRPRPPPRGGEPQQPRRSLPRPGRLHPRPAALRALRSPSGSAPSAPTTPRWRTSLSNLAGLCRAQGDYARALPLYERCARHLGARPRPRPPRRGDGPQQPRPLYQDQGDYARALPLFERALAICERALGPDHPQVAQSLNNLAALYQDQGDYARALPLYERALAICERALGPDHPHVAASLNNLAGLYRAQGDYARALPLYERALAIAERALGPDHPHVAASLNNLAVLYRAQGDYARALPLYERALAISERALGPDHPEVATSLNNLAGSLPRPGRLRPRAAALRARARHPRARPRPRPPPGGDEPQQPRPSLPGPRRLRAGAAAL